MSTTDIYLDILRHKFRYFIHTSYLWIFLEVWTSPFSFWHVFELDFQLNIYVDISKDISWHWYDMNRYNRYPNRYSGACLWISRLDILHAQVARKHPTDISQHFQVYLEISKRCPKWADPRWSSSAQPNGGVCGGDHAAESSWIEIDWVLSRPCLLNCVSIKLLT